MIMETDMIFKFLSFAVPSASMSLKYAPHLSSFLFSFTSFVFIEKDTRKAFNYGEIKIKI